MAQNTEDDLVLLVIHNEAMLKSALKFYMVCSVFSRGSSDSCIVRASHKHQTTPKKT